MTKQIQKRTIKVVGVDLGLVTQPVKFKVLPARGCIVAASKGKPKIRISQSAPKVFVAEVLPVALGHFATSNHPATAFARSVEQFWANGANKATAKKATKKTPVKKTAVKAKKAPIKKVGTAKMRNNGDIFAGL